MNKVENKAVVRTKIIKQRVALTQSDVVRLSQKIETNLFSLNVFQNARLVMAYMAFRNEVLTKGIIEKSLAQGKKVVLPYVVPGKKILIPSLVENLRTDLVAGVYGILEPDPRCLKPVEPAQIDLVLVPGVVFDRSGNRLGYGGGYYDRFLPQCSFDTVFIALGYDFQVTGDLSGVVEEHDQKVHYLITDKEVYRVGDTPGTQ